MKELPKCPFNVMFLSPLFQLVSLVPCSLSFRKQFFCCTNDLQSPNITEKLLSSHVYT